MLSLVQPMIIILLITIANLHTVAATSSQIPILRSTDITCNGKYPLAVDGYAQAPNGCTAVPDKWGRANFSPTCDDHDRCYYTLGASVDECNKDFCSGLRQTCKQAYCNKYGICLPYFWLCTAAAEGYCGVVRALEVPVFKRAQGIQRRYEECLEESGGVSVSPAGGLLGWGGGGDVLGGEGLGEV